MKKQANFFLIILVIYVFLQFIWWGNLLIRLNGQVAISSGDYQRRVWMVIGEGSVFMVLLFLGIWKMRKVILKEIGLTQRQSNFLLSITHELKTPIAVTQLNLETLQKRKLEPAQQDKMIASTLQEANRLNMLCDNILLASQLDGKAYQESRIENNLSDLVEGCIDTFKQHYPLRLVTEQIEPTLYLDGETLLLQMLVNNLLENAQKYAPQDTEIKVVLAAHGKQIKLEVVDSGKGIPDTEKSKIFEKFYRIGSEATRNTKGTGLGLYLCKKIAENHNANISVTDNKPQGSIFVVTFNS